MTRKRDMIDPATLDKAYEVGRKVGSGESGNNSLVEGFWSGRYYSWAYHAGVKQGEKDLAVLRRRILSGTPCDPDRELVVPGHGGIIKKPAGVVLIGEAGPEVQIDPTDVTASLTNRDHATDDTACTGAYDCPVERHICGCYADNPCQHNQHKPLDRQARP